MMGEEKMAEKFDVTKHIFVPKHVKMGDSEVEALLQQYNITKKQLPKILRSDPALKNIDVKPGDVIRIVRKSQTSGEAFYYRMVVNA